MQLPRPPRRRQTILLTSLVDVLFVLLFFFMLVSGGNRWNSVGMDLAGPLGNAPGQPLQTLELLPDGGLRLNGEALSEPEVAARLRLPGARAVLVAAPGVSLQRLIDVFDRYQREGATLTLGRGSAR